MRCAALLTLGVLAAALVAGCSSSTNREKGLADPRVGHAFYLCCNLHYDKPEITDANYTAGTLVPFATRVEILKVTRGSVQFKPAGHSPLTLEYRHGSKGLPFNEYLDHLFVADDPRLKLRKVNAKQVKLMESSTVAPGMTKDQVVMTLGYPPADRTPSLEASTWTYYASPSQTFTVSFDGGGKVTQVTRPR
jgi:outer membrane protein assembly factor BamE (lipoprotein component of BamABCDE complex)